jgi:hypothetical protein
MIGLIFLLLVGAGAWSLEAWLAALRAIARAVLAPFMIHELFPSLTETASGSHPCCVVSVTYDRTSFTAVTRVQIPSGTPNLFRSLRGTATFGAGTKRHNSVVGNSSGEQPQSRSPAHRSDESPAGYSSASCSPAELASASPAERHPEGEKED